MNLLISSCCVLTFLLPVALGAMNDPFTYTGFEVSAKRNYDLHQCALKIMVNLAVSTDTDMDTIVRLTIDEAKYSGGEYEEVMNASPEAREGSCLEKKLCTITGWSEDNKIASVEYLLDDEDTCIRGSFRVRLFYSDPIGFSDVRTEIVHMTRHAEDVTDPITG